MASPQWRERNAGEEDQYRVIRSHLRNLKLRVTPICVLAILLLFAPVPKNSAQVIRHAFAWLQPNQPTGLLLREHTRTPLLVAGSDHDRKRPALETSLAIPDSGSQCVPNFSHCGR